MCGNHLVEVESALRVERDQLGTSEVKRLEPMKAP